MSAIGHAHIDTGWLWPVRETVRKTARTFSLTNSRQQENAIDAFKSICKKYTKNKVGKRPFTNINIVQI